MSTTEKHTFQAEIAQLLEIVIHSLLHDRPLARYLPGEGSPR